MEILTWNLQFCFKKDDSLWLKFARTLMEMDFDFLLLQEINPIYIYRIQEKEKYRIQNDPVYAFNINNKNIYYHELIESNQYPFWGTAIITKEKYKLIDNHLYKNNAYIGSKYFGHESLMCYTFESNNGIIVTIMNFYKKGDNSKAIYDKNGNWTPYGKDYDYEEGFFSDISKIANIIKENKNILIFAGDFNANYDTLEKIEGVGFKEKTKFFGSTMVKKNYHNDCIFVNERYSNCINENDIERFYFKEHIDFSDHYGIKCKIEL
jgi:hypothetical protein